MTRKMKQKMHGGLSEINGTNISGVILLLTTAYPANSWLENASLGISLSVTL